MFYGAVVIRKLVTSVLGKDRMSLPLYSTYRQSRLLQDDLSSRAKVMESMYLRANDTATYNSPIQYYTVYNSALSGVEFSVL